MPKRTIAYGLLLVLTLVTGAIIALYLDDASMAPPRRLVMPTSAKTYNLLIADTEAERRQGLSDRKALSQNQGMLFVDDKVGRQCFWMKNMQFPIDIVWIDADKKIVAIERNVAPDTYPRTYCADAQYVIELNAGVAGKNNLRIGQRLAF